MFRHDLTGQKFARLTVFNFSHREKSLKGGKYFWWCLCDCGNRLIVNSSNLKNGHSKSCGCLRTQLLIERNTTHGFSHRKSWAVWYNMIARCHDKNHASFEWYGKRGIFVCQRWHSYENFFMDMGEPPPFYEIDRINNNEGYYKDNCRWATKEEQLQNKRQRKSKINPKEV